MSHFTKLAVQILDQDVAAAVAEKRGWAVTRQEEHVNGYSKETVSDCSVYRDSRGMVKMVVDKEGNVIHDRWYMGAEAHDFVRDYSEEFIRSMAAREGAMVNDLGVDEDGARVLEVQYLF